MLVNDQQLIGANLKLFWNLLYLLMKVQTGFYVFAMAETGALSYYIDTNTFQILTPTVYLRM